MVRIASDIVQPELDAFDQRTRHPVAEFFRIHHQTEHFHELGIFAARYLHDDRRQLFAGAGFVQYR